MKAHYTADEIAIIKLAKKYKISMATSGVEEVEFWEEDRNKQKEFIKELLKINPLMKIVELISIKQHIDTRGNDIRKSKSLYLVDDDYYNALIGNVQEVNAYEDNEQISLFST